MRHLQIAAALSIAAFLAPAAENPAKVSFVEHDRVAAAINRGGNLVVQSDRTVSGSHRDKAGQVEIHDAETDVIYMVDGEATFVTGGTVEGLHKTRPGQSLGTSSTGGETHHLMKGDVIVVPAGVPHWFKELHTPTVSYYVVKVIKQ
jgi:uncharacterized RmlC-like cupin family protein